MRHNISKSDFIAGAQCKKQFWLRKHKPNLQEQTESTRTADGDEVGELARRFFPESIEIPLGRIHQMAADTIELMQETPVTICEATFQADGLSCSADIIRYDGGCIDIYEVKSSSSVKEVQLMDLAFQTHVIRAAGYHVRASYLMHVNGDYVRSDTLDVHEFLKVEDKTLDVALLDPQIQEELRVLRPLLDEMEEEEPIAPIGPACEKPYRCPFRRYCFSCAGVPETGSVFDAPGLTMNKKYALWNKGYATLQQLKTADGVLTPAQHATISSMFLPDNGFISVNRRALAPFLDGLRFPIYHLDFESFTKAVPMFNGAVPFEQTPFQYSLHIQAAPGPGAEHKEFLARAGEDPRRVLAEQLCRDIPMNVQTMAYNKSFEASICRRLASLYPDLAEHLLNIAANLADLMIPFQKKWVTCAAMHGSYSIKAVLPALCGDQKQLDYRQLPGPHNGQEASAAFLSMMEMHDAQEIETLRAGLLMYCGLDTLAMVSVLNKLYELCGKEF